MLLTTPKEVGAYIRDRRRAAGLTQQELATTNDVSTRWLIDVESGKPSAQIGLVMRVLRSLGVLLDASEQLTPEPPETRPVQAMTADLPRVDLDHLFPAQHLSPSIAEALRNIAPQVPLDVTVSQALRDVVPKVPLDSTMHRDRIDGHDDEEPS